MPFLSFLSQIYIYILVERSIELDISNRIGDASATAATTIYPIGDFSRSRIEIFHLITRMEKDGTKKLKHLENVDTTTNFLSNYGMYSTEFVTVIIIIIMMMIIIIIIIIIIRKLSQF